MLAFLLLMVLQPGVEAQTLREQLDQGLDWAACGGPLAEVPPIEAASRIELSAAAAELYPDQQQVTLFGEVMATQQGMRLDAGQLTFVRETGEIQAQNGVLLDGAGLRIFADRAQLDLAERRGELEQTEFRLLNQRARGEAQRIELLDEQRSQLYRMRYTRCSPNDDSWILAADRLQVDRGTGIGEAWGALLTFKDLPLVYAPYLQFPVDDRRMSGLLAPVIGYDSSYGLDLTIPYYFNIAPQMDATLSPRILSNTGLMLGGELRHLGSYGHSELELEYLPNDSQRADEGGARGAVNVGSSGSLDDNTRWRLDLAYVSDDEYLDDFGNNLSLESQTHLRRRAELIQTGAYGQLLGRLEYFQTIDPDILPNKRPYARLPQLLHSWETSEGLGPLHAELRNEYVRFDRSHGVTGQRLDLYAALGLPLERVWGFLRPRLSLRHTRYLLEADSNEPVDPDFDEDPTRSLPAFSLDGGLYFDRSTRWFGRDLTQTLEPRLFYLRVPEREQRTLPVFDTSLPTFGFSSLFRENRFNGADRVGDANQLTLGLSSRILQASDGVERLRMGVGGIVYFDDRNVTLEGDDVDTDSRSSLVAELETSITERLRLRTAVQWNNTGDQGNTERSAFQLSWKGDRQRLLNLAYHYDENRLEIADLSFRQPLTSDTNAIGRWNYSLRDEETMEVFAGLEYDSCCWALRGLVRRHLNEVGDDPDTQLMLQLELKGLAGLGNGLDDFLEKGISGYDAETGD